VADLGAKAGARRIDYDEIGDAGVWLLHRRRFEEVEGVLGDALVSLAVEVAGEVSHGGGRGFDSNDAFESLGERLSEESDAGVEVPGERALPLSNDLFEQFRDEGNDSPERMRLR